MFTRVLKKEKGFTLLEAILVVLILAILAAVIVPRLLYSRTEAQRQACRSNLATINSQCERYYLETGNTATGAAGDINNSNFFPDGWPNCPAGGAYTITAGRAVCPTGHTL